MTPAIERRARKFRVVWRRKSRCEHKGHEWFGGNIREFIQSRAVCLRCSTEKVYKPYGNCLSGHPLSDHYTDQGVMVPALTCGWPQ